MDVRWVEFRCGDDHGTRVKAVEAKYLYLGLGWKARAGVWPSRFSERGWNEGGKDTSALYE